MKKSRYTKAPMPPPELEARFQKVLEVMSGRTSVSEAARQLGWSRNHFQSVLNTGLTGMLGALAPKPPGPKAKPPEMVELESRVRHLEEDNAWLEEKLEQMHRLMALTSQVVRGQRGRARRAASTPRKEKATKSDSEEPHGCALLALEEARAMKAAGAPAGVAAMLIGKSAATVRRWQSRAARSERLCNRRGPRAEATEPENFAAAVKRARDMKGHIGAAALARAGCGLSRRLEHVSRRARPSRRNHRPKEASAEARA